MVIFSEESTVFNSSLLQLSVHVVGIVREDSFNPINTRGLFQTDTKLHDRIESEYFRHWSQYSAVH